MQSLPVKSPDRVAVSLHRVAWPLGCAAAALAIATLPNVWARLHFGSWFWISDHDGWIYLQVLAHAGPASPYPWLLFGPARLAQRWLGWGPARLTLAWSIQAALLTALPLYCWLEGLLRDCLPNPAPQAALLSLLFCFDTGVLHYFPVLRQFAALWKLPLLLRQTYPHLLRQWNVLSPALWLGYLFLFLLLERRAALHPAWRRKLAAMASLAALAYVYFYLWSAALVGLLLLALLDCFLPAAVNRSFSLLRCRLEIAAGGLLAGLPALIAGSQTMAAGWLSRNGLWVHRFRHEPFHAGNLLLYALTLIWIWRRERDLLPLWTTSLAAWLLFFFQPLLFGRELQNFHWLYIRNPLLYLLWLLLAARAAARYNSRWGAAALACLIGAMAVSGFYLRWRQADASAGSLEAMRQWRAWTLSSPSPSPPRAAGMNVAAGNASYVRLAVIRAGWRPLSGDAVLLNPLVPSREWMARTALNLYLQAGPDPSAWHSAALAWLRREGRLHSELPWTSVPARRRRLLAHLRQNFIKIRRNPLPGLSLYQVGLIALPAGRPAPWLPPGWRRLACSPSWQCWKAPGAAAPLTTPRRH